MKKHLVTTALLVLVVFAFAPYSTIAQRKPTTLASRSQQWRCDTEQKWGCELPGGCERQDPSKVWVQLDFAKSTYQRCDRAGCRTYAMTVTENGLFTYLRLDDHPDTFMKIGLVDMFVEVAAQGISTLNSFGTCKTQR